METELKPCPFCGGRAELHEEGNYCLVKCTQCGAETGIVRMSLKYCANEKVIEAWNRRAKK